jgi:hypothetical protein
LEAHKEKTVPEELRGQRPRTSLGWLATARALQETEAYRQFVADRKPIGFSWIPRFVHYCYRVSGMVWLPRGIAHPYYYREVLDGVDLWTSWLTRRQRDRISDWTYSLLGREKAYGATHALFNALVLPEGIPLDYDRSILGFTLVDRKYLGNQSHWVSNDYRTRKKMAAEVAGHEAYFVKQSRASKRNIILDVCGGSGESAVLIAQAKEIPKGTMIVVREFNADLIAEGRAMIRAMKAQGMPEEVYVTFLQGDARVPFLSAVHQLGIKTEVLPEADKNDLGMITEWLTAGAEISAAVASYCMGAIHHADASYQAAQAIAVQMAEDIAEEGKVLIVDFADPRDDRDNYLRQTKAAGRLYFLWMRDALLGKYLKTCYRNWDHRVGHLWSEDEPGNMEMVCQAMKKAGYAPERRWNQATFGFLPFGILRGKVLILLVPGYAEQTLAYVKPGSPASQGSGKNR